MGGMDKWEKNNFDPPPDLWDRETVLGCLDATVADMKGRRKIVVVLSS